MRLVGEEVSEMAPIEIAGNPQFVRFAVAEHPERGGTFGIIMVDARNGVTPVGRDNFRSQDEALNRLGKALSELIG
jgi:hypothetical protein